MRQIAGLAVVKGERDRGIPVGFEVHRGPVIAPMTFSALSASGGGPARARARIAISACARVNPAVSSTRSACRIAGGVSVGRP